MTSEILEGSVESIIYNNPENGYSVFDLVYNQGLVTVKGFFSMLHEGDFLRLKGRWTSHPEYGEQFTADSYEFIPPSTSEAIERYLSSGAFKGIGRITAKKIVDLFGDNTLNIIRDDYEKLCQIKGINLEKAKSISETYNDKYILGNITMFLQQFGIGSNLTFRIYQLYGDNTIEIVRENPYRLAEEVQGVGFRTADLIALKLGLPEDSKERICSGIKYILMSASGNGHVYLPEDVLIEEGSRILRVDGALLKESLIDLEIKGDIRRVRLDDSQSPGVYINYMFRCESFVARRLIELSREDTIFGVTDIDKRIKIYEKREGIILADNQVRAIKESLTNSVMVITGGPGTGKTTIIKGIINIFHDEGFEVAIAAPTGRAAKRITEATGYEAKTIHRLLEPAYVIDVEEPRFIRNSDNPLDADVVILDETSMVDINIMYHLLMALKDGTRLIMAGDADQLPSVGPGKVLNSIIESGVIKCVELKEIYRQAESSYIVYNAHSINRGEMPVTNEKGGDFYLMQRDKPGDIVKLITDLCSQRLPKAYGFDPIRDIQVLTPMRRGQVGVEGLNIELQQYLNPASNSKSEKSQRHFVFRVGDKVMQIRNNYDLRWVNKYDESIEGTGVFNGDMGIITDINHDFRYIIVEFDDDRIVKYDFTVHDQLEHAYAITIHKSQGSEFDAIVIPLYSGPPMLYTRNLIYTAVTRAKKLVVLVGNPAILEKMISNTNEQLRYTALAEFLIKESSGDV